MKIAIDAPKTARSILSRPTDIPIAAVIHISAAVVKPDAFSSFLKIAPAPKNPTPEIICANILLDPSTDANSVNKQLPIQIIAKVLILGSLPANSLSTPTALPNNAAIIRR